MSNIKSAIDELLEQRRRNEADAAAARAGMEGDFNRLTPMVRKALQEVGDRKWGRFPLRSVRYKIVPSLEDLTWILVPRLAFMLEEGDRRVRVRLFRRRVGDGSELAFQIDACDERAVSDGIKPEDLEKALLRVVPFFF